MHLTLEQAEKKISDFGIKDMPLVEITPTKCTVTPDWFSKYKSLCHEFAQTLTDSVDTLAFMNFDQDEFMNLIMGNKIPENVSIRFRTPLSLGGKLELDNLFMCWTYPVSYNIDRFIISQYGNETIWLPNPARKIYLPASTGGGGEGGNGTEDRLTETIASQIAADRDM